jgi:hypothetical protein
MNTLTPFEIDWDVTIVMMEDGAGMGTGRNVVFVSDVCRLGALQSKVTSPYPTHFVRLVLLALSFLMPPWKTPYHQGAAFSRDVMGDVSRKAYLFGRANTRRGGTSHPRLPTVRMV